SVEVPTAPSGTARGVVERHSRALDPRIRAYAHPAAGQYVEAGSKGKLDPVRVIDVEAIAINSRLNCIRGRHVVLAVRYSSRAPKCQSARGWGDIRRERVSIDSVVIRSGGGFVAAAIHSH